MRGSLPFAENQLPLFTPLVAPPSFPAAAVRYFAEQLSGELGQDPSVKTVATLVATVSVCERQQRGGEAEKGTEREREGHTHTGAAGGTTQHTAQHRDARKNWCKGRTGLSSDGALGCVQMGVQKAKAGPQ